MIPRFRGGTDDLGDLVAAGFGRNSVRGSTFLTEVREALTPVHICTLTATKLNGLG